MPPDMPLVCPSKPYTLLTDNVSFLDHPDGLMLAACAAGMIYRPELDVEFVDAALNELADETRSLARANLIWKTPGGKLQALRHVLFEQRGMSGVITPAKPAARSNKQKSDPHDPAAQQYNHPDRSDMQQVLTTGTGLPIVMSMVFHLVGRRIGINTCGIGLPGHFVAGVIENQKLELIDCYSGGNTLDLAAAQTLQDLPGGKPAAGAGYGVSVLKPVSGKRWITRMLQNLLRRFETDGNYLAVAAVLEMQQLLWPSHTQLKRDLGLVLARLGQKETAIDLLQHYLDETPDDPNQQQLRQLLARLRN